MSRVKKCKLVVVGDAIVGKTSFLVRFCKDVFDERIQRLDNSWPQDVTVDGSNFEVTGWDTVGQDQYARLRPLAYPQTDILLLCFSVDSPSSLANIKTKWVPEVIHHCPDTPFMLVGMKRDLRKSTVTAESSDSTHQSVDITAAHQLAKETGAAGYYETSALTGEGVSDAIEAAIRVVNNRLSQRKFTWPWKRKSGVGVPEYSTNVSESGLEEASGGLAEDSKASDREDMCKGDSKKDSACGGSEN